MILNWISFLIEYDSDPTTGDHPPSKGLGTGCRLASAVTKQSVS